MFKKMKRSKIEMFPKKMKRSKKMKSVPNPYAVIS